MDIESKIVSSLEIDLSSELSAYGLFGSNSGVQSERAHQLVSKIFKKMPVSDTKLEKEAFELFSTMNRRGFNFECPVSLCEQGILDEVAFEFEKLLRPLEHCSGEWLDFLAPFGYFGTGSSTGVEDNSQATKYGCGPLTTSNPRLYPAYRRYCMTTGWWAAERSRQRLYGVEVLKGASLTFVPKDRTKYRSVCTEPSLDMFFQLSLHTWLAARVDQVFGIDIRTQERINQNYARLGSKYDCYSTIDSTSASDTLYLHYLQTIGIIPDWFSSLLREIKSPLITYKDKTIKIAMAGTMGCGFTFSVMTALFCCVCRAVYSSLRIPTTRELPMFAVYGDDIIVVPEAYELVTRIIQVLGFIPNMAKSYHLGEFKESCGRDYLRGHNVRPVFCKGLTSAQERFTLYNNLLEWSVRNNIPLWGTLRTIAESVPLDDRFLVPLSAPVDAGLRVPEFISGYSMESHYVAFEPKSHSKKPSGILHSDAKVQFVVAGYFDGKRCPLRSDTNTKYIVKSRYSPCWDSLFGWGSSDTTREYMPSIKRLSIYAFADFT
jgi:hypothetical protein